MSILITNDDGIDAPGLHALKDALAYFSDQIFIVAPEGQRSECGHAATTSKPIPIREDSPNQFAIDGTPVDCVRIALSEICPKVDWVFSGINHGANLGMDLYISGTVAAVREACIFGKKGIAFSHFWKEHSDLDWEKVSKYVKKSMDFVCRSDAEKNFFWNVNFPNTLRYEGGLRIIQGPVSCLPLPVQYKRLSANTYQYTGAYISREIEKDSDVDICFSGNISISKVGI